MKRREFLSRIAGALAAVGMMPPAGFPRMPRKKRAPRAATNPKLNRVSVSTWSFHNYFQSTRERDFNLPGEMLALLDFPEMVADRYKVHHLEFCAPHFASTEPAYLRELKGRLTRQRSTVVNIPVDIREIWNKGGLSDPDKGIRVSAVNAAKKWIDIAAALGCRAVRCDPGKMDVNNLAPTVASYKALAAYGQAKRIQVIIENHGGVGSEHPEELVKLYKEVGSPFLGALPDFGNFPDEATREKGLRLLFPYARVVCHAKGLEFDANGNETQFDFPKCVEISKNARYRGVYSIEYEGRGDPYAGVQKVVDELLKYL